jgi:hypothetical protein
MRLPSTVTLLAVGTLLSVACEKDQPAPLVPAAGTVQAVDNATMEVANARCDREQRCNEIGESKKYSTREHCLTVMKKEATDDFSDCRTGVDQEDLRECLTEIANQDCSGLFSGFDEFVSCGMDDLCND